MSEMNLLKSRVFFLAGIILVMGNLGYARAYRDCENIGTQELRSTSCYTRIKKDKSVIFEVSSTTLRYMLVVSKKHYAYMVPSLKTISEKLANNNVLGFGFVYDRNPSAGRYNNSNCVIYRRLGLGSLDWGSELYKLGWIQGTKLVCDREILGLVKAFGRAIDMMSGRHVSGIKKIYYSSYPDTRVSSWYKNAEFSELWLISQVIDIEPEFLESEDAEFTNFPVGVFKHTVRENETLSSIAKEYTGSAANWKGIWALNSRRLRNPNVLRPGDRVDVPASIATWVPVNLDSMSDERMATIIYGSIRALDKIGWARQEARPGFTTTETHFIPMFATHSQTTGAITNTADLTYKTQ